ncbi:ComEA family DNA-binding protein [Rubrivirga marina]|uniref:Helix-hairpin-helix DNA-binding motif class 1 domain-containing protein n=1 Tax=Rubrivirga marina TaxID=1196024 RepID=A0A271J7F2_9BACT|nr:helix-hairpin-helix domain-containing protein [Rubrivirga marina]PAP78569.1 hypothetical protein BSZ37_20130 [Rubrivirga marina]
MTWLYRLRTRLGLSEVEATAALTLLLALLGGTVARHLQATSAPIPADFYAASDAAFATAAADTTREAAPAVPLALAAMPEAPASAAPAADSTAAEIADAAVERAAAPRRSGKPPPAPTNLNTASAQELQRLPRIGPALAGRIVEHRRTHGPFRTPEQITEVKGIGEKTLERMRPWIRL